MSEAMQGYIKRHGFADSFLFLGSKTTSEIRGEIEFSMEEGMSSYQLSLVPSVGDLLVFSEESIVFQYKTGDEPVATHFESGGKESALLEKESLPLDMDEIRIKFAAGMISQSLSKKRVYQFHDTTLESGLRKTGYDGDALYLRSDGGNLPAVLYRLQRIRPDCYRRIVLQLRRMIPGFRDFVLESEGHHVLLRWRSHDPDYIFGPHQLSDGSLRLMALTTLFLQPDDMLPDMIIVDEPELGLHPEAEAFLAGLAQSVSSRCQILLATQSASFVDHFEPEDIIVCEIADAASTFRRLNRSELDAWLEDYTLGEIWRKNVIGGQP
jgi:predicted ATPase